MSYSCGGELHLWFEIPTQILYGCAACVMDTFITSGVLVNVLGVDRNMWNVWKTSPFPWLCICQVSRSAWMTYSFIPDRATGAMSHQLATLILHIILTHFLSSPSIWRPVDSEVVVSVLHIQNRNYANTECCRGYFRSLKSHFFLFSFALIQIEELSCTVDVRRGAVVLPFPFSSLLSCPVLFYCFMLSFIAVYLVNLSSF